MKALRCLAVFISLFIIMMMQGCGGGGTSDTAGSLTMTDATSTDNKDGTFSVATAVTYAPPAGKSAQGVVITTTASDSFGVVITDKATLTSGSNTVKYSFLIAQHVGFSNRVSIESSIGGMTASVGVTIPAFVVPILVSPTSVAFAVTDTATSVKTVAVSGGTPPYSVSSSVPADISATISGSSLSITLLNAAVLPGTSSSATVTVTDSAATAQTKAITVSYFK